MSSRNAVNVSARDSPCLQYKGKLNVTIASQQNGSGSVQTHYAIIVHWLIS